MSIRHLDAGRLYQGEMVYKFEKQFAELHDQKYGIALNSGTSALHIGLEALKEKYKWTNGKKRGSFGDIAGFSTYVAHTITTGVGGLLTTNDRELMEISRPLLAHSV